MAKSKGDSTINERQGRVRSAGELAVNIAGTSFKKFGFVQSAVISRWAEIVGERYAKVSVPESIRFPSGKKSDGTLTLMVEGAHAPLMQHLAPMVMERVNRFFGYEAVTKVAFRQGRIARPAARAPRPQPAPVPKDIGENLREVADPELRAVLESLASKLSGSTGAPGVDNSKDRIIPFLVRSDKK
nr:DUF721 domain-containing protein [uncultured Sphingomonas sp.]